MEKTRNYSRFYSLLRQMPEADKETLVEQFTNGRTVHVHEMSEAEYRVMCNEMERVSGYAERSAAYKKSRKRQRSICLHSMQQLGIDTSDWQRVNDFCRNKRISGKPFAALSVDELKALHVKLLMISRNGGLKKKYGKTEGQLLIMMRKDGKGS